MTKRTIEGIEVSEGVSKKTGNAYSIGTLYTTTELAPARNPDDIALGRSGDKFQCDAAILKRIKHLSFPLLAEVETKEVMRYGVRELVVVDVKPLAVAK